MLEDHTRHSERTTRLETQNGFILAQLTSMQKKQDEMYDVILQLKGAKWSLLAIASFMGFIISTATTYFIGKYHV